MSGASEPERSLVDYLLGRLPEVERVQLEGRLFSDGDLDEQLLATADELIHSYLTGKLRPDERQLFESHFLAAPDHRERVDFMRHLLAAMGRTAEPGAAGVRSWLPMAAAVVAALGAIVLVVRQREARPRNAIASPSAPAPMPPRGQGTASPAPGLPPPKVDPVRLVRLPRDARALVEVGLSSETRVVRIHVAVDDTSPSFDAVVRNADGRDVWRGDGLASPVGEPLVFEVPADVLASGDYSLRIEGEPLRESPPRLLEYRLRLVRDAAPPPHR